MDFWTRSKSGDELPIYAIIGFQTQDQFSPDQTQNNAIFDRPDIIEASCVIGSTKFPDNEYQVDFERNKYNDLYNEVRRFYKDFIQAEGAPYISFKEFKELYPLVIFDLRHQKDVVSSQSVQARFRFRAGYDAVGQNLQAIGLLLTQKIISVSVRWTKTIWYNINELKRIYERTRTTKQSYKRLWISRSC